MKNTILTDREYDIIYGLLEDAMLDIKHNPEYQKLPEEGQKFFKIYLKELTNLFIKIEKIQGEQVK